MRIREYQLKYGIILDEPVEEEKKNFDHEAKTKKEAKRTGD